MTPRVRALYVHIPFCERRCEYCDFAAVAGLRGHTTYVDAVISEINAVTAALPGLELDTIFLGGGTPGLLPPRELTAILDAVRAGCTIDSAAEITLEANPSSTSEARAQGWRAAGVNRVSVGIQSLDPGVLRFLGRIHGPEQAMNALAAVRSAGISRVSADLIYAVPGLEDVAWLDSLERILACDPGHVSAYELTVESGTPLGMAVAAGRAPAVDAEAALRHHRMAVETCAAHGYRQYEVSNFCRPGLECRHNLAYWANEYYLAVGVGAHGHLRGAEAAAVGLPVAADDTTAVRYWHAPDPDSYCDAVRAGAPWSGWEVLDGRSSEAERILVGLRRNAGVALAEGAAREAVVLAQAGLLRWDGHVAATTPRGEEMLNAIALRLVQAEDSWRRSPTRYTRTASGDHTAPTTGVDPGDAGVAEWGSAR